MSDPVLYYSPSSFARDWSRTRSGRFFPSHSWKENTDHAWSEGLGEFGLFSLELLYFIFDKMDLISLGKLTTTSSDLRKKITSYFTSSRGWRRLQLNSLHGRLYPERSNAEPISPTASPPIFAPPKPTTLEPFLEKIRGVALFLKRSTCLWPSRERLPLFYTLAEPLNCCAVRGRNLECRKSGDECRGLILLGELFHLFIAGWEDAEVKAACNFMTQHSGLQKIIERVYTSLPGTFVQAELSLRSFISKVFLRDGHMEDEEKAFWLSHIVSKYETKIQAYFLYVIFGAVGPSRPQGTMSVRWAEMGETTPSTPAVAKEWFKPLADALRALYQDQNLWTSREVLTLMHEITVLHGETWLLENAACLLLECGPEMIQDLLMSRVNNRKVCDIGAWVAALSVAVVHLNERSKMGMILSTIRRVVLALGSDTESRDHLFSSISNTFQEFVVEYAELMTDDESRLNDLKKILKGESYFQLEILHELSSHFPSRRSGRQVRVGKSSLRFEE